jgi:hypothetical protein
MGNRRATGQDERQRRAKFDCQRGFHVLISCHARVNHKIFGLIAKRKPVIGLYSRVFNQFQPQTSMERDPLLYSYLNDSIGSKFAAL